MKKAVGVVCGIGLLAMGLGAFGQVDPLPPSQAWIPGIASLALPGLGQFLNNQVDKAFLHLGIAVALDIGTYYLVGLLPLGYYSYPLVGLVHLAWGLYSGLDAYNVAKEQGFTIGTVEDGLGLGFSAAF